MTRITTSKLALAAALLVALAATAQARQLAQTTSAPKPAASTPATVTPDDIPTEFLSLFNSAVQQAVNALTPSNWMPQGFRFNNANDLLSMSNVGPITAPDK